MICGNVQCAYPILNIAKPMFSFTVVLHSKNI